MLNGGRSYGRSGSAPIITMPPSKPSSRRVSTALPPAMPAPAITKVSSLIAGSSRNGAARGGAQRYSALSSSVISPTDDFASPNSIAVLSP